jgi:hypothetical protein
MSGLEARAWQALMLLPLLLHCCARHCFLVAMVKM